MAPPKNVRGAGAKQTLLPLARKGVSTRSQNVQDQNIEPNINRGKRKADNSPLKNDKVKRSALGNLTNNVIQQQETIVFKKTATVLSLKNGNTAGPSRGPKILTRAAAKVAVNQKPANSTTIVKRVQIKETVEIKPARRISNEFEKTEDSLYMSALEDMPSSDSIRFSGNFESKRVSISYPELKELSISTDNDDTSKRIMTPSPLKYPSKEFPEGVLDFDKENWNDPFQVSHYAMDIFNYLKSRESQFVIDDYLEKQQHLTKWMRSLLIDWMVEVQETFELNHETLYLAVKLVDLYLSKVTINKDKLQLLGAASLYISSKYDERTPPLVEDFMYICDGAYADKELITMEISVLKTIGFDLGIPLSYRFLRRYARCAKVPMPTLTLARYILELSLLDYSNVFLSDSQLACATLFMALRMTGTLKPWDKTLEYYTGYKIEDFAHIVPMLNAALHRKPREALKTIRNKYSHRIFYDVASTPLLTTDKLFEHTGLIEQPIPQPNQ